MIAIQDVLAPPEGQSVEAPVGIVLPAPRWETVGASVRGASHARNGLPNQDAIAWRHLAGVDGEPALCVAVSDGHGSAKCFRSDVGSRLAVEIALAVMEDVHAQGPDVRDLAVLQDAAEQIVWRWRAAVGADVLADPLTEQEFETLERKDGLGARRTVERSPWVAYGATLLAALATPQYVVYVQLGDGDILAVDEGGAVFRPLSGDPLLFADQTTSLCSRDAIAAFRVGLQLADSSASALPTLLLLATDGYANSFRTDAGFLQVGSDLLDAVRTEGLAAVGDCLETWLHEASACGSGDDVTVAIASRGELRDE